MKTLALIQVLAQDSSGNSGGGWQPLILIGLMFVVMWVVMIRPQQKRQKEQQKKIEALKKNDKVVTIGGLHGVVNHVGKQTLSLRVADGQFLTFDKKAIATVLTEKSEKLEESEKSEDEVESDSESK